jgi:hypothetical protein
MRNFLRTFSPVQWLTGVVVALVVTYIGLIAFVMSYAAIQTETAQSVRDSSAEVSLLETQYFDKTSALGAIDPGSLGYSAPIAKNYALGPTRAAILTSGE